MWGRILIYTVLALGLSGLVLLRANAPQPGLALLLLSVLGLGLQLAAISLPGFGFFSASFAPCFALGLSGQPGVAVALMLAGVLLRSLLHLSQHSPQRTACEALAELLPALAALAAVSLVPSGALNQAAAGLMLYLPLALKLPELLLADSGVSDERMAVWTRHRELTGLQILSVGLMGPALAYLVQLSPWFGLWLFPVLAGLHQAARIDLLRLELVDRQALQRREEKSRHALAATREELGETARALDMETQERRLLQQLTCALADSPDLKSLLQVIVSTTVKLVPCQSVAVFLADQDRLLPAAHASPFGQKLEGELILREGEPIVEECWSTGQVTLGSGRRLFAGEPTAVALPMQREAVLYVGRARQSEFAPLERQYLLAIAGAGGLGIQSARRFHEQRQALELHAEAHAKLAVWVERLSYLLDSARQLSAGLSVDQIAERLQSMLCTTVPHRSGAIGLAGRAGLTWPSEFWTTEHLANLKALSEVVERNQVPLLVDEPSTFRGPGFGSGVGSFVACPLVGDRGSLGSLVLVSDGVLTREQMDVLALIAFQAAAALQNAALHEEVVQAQAQLLQSSKLAAVGQLAAGVAHELNTPLCVSLVALEMLRMYIEMGQLEEVEEQLTAAETAGNRCKDIIAKLLYYARDSASGKSEADLNEVVRDTLELLGRQLTLDGVRIEPHLAPTLPRVRVNPNEIQQAITNLLINARDAVLQGSERLVTIATESDDKSVRVIVTDRGPGMPPEVLGRVFEPFFTTKEVGKGTGLGLSVSREILTRHGGDLTAESAPGKGSRFVLRLPPAG